MLHGNVDGVFDDALVQIANDVLNDAELLEQFSAGIENFMREDVLLSINPQIGEAFLCGVKNLREIAKTSFFVKDFICLAKLLSVGASCAVRLENFTKTLDLVEEALASPLAIFGVKVVFFIGPLLEMVAHHNRVLQKEKIW